jgi:hypothetical protein
MSRYDDVRRMREARFAIKAAAPDETRPVTKMVTKPISVTKPNSVAKTCRRYET